MGAKAEAAPTRAAARTERYMVGETENPRCPARNKKTDSLVIKMFKSCCKMEMEIPIAIPRCE